MIKTELWWVCFDLVLKLYGKIVGFIEFYGPVDQFIDIGIGTLPLDNAVGANPVITDGPRLTFPTN